METEVMQIENVRLLLVEDDSDYLEFVKESLEDFGYRHIECASNATEAKQKLRDPFDVIISDLQMEGDDNRGFAVIDEVETKELSSVVIILTANDTATACRTAFKKDVWDYIEKYMTGGDAINELNESIKKAIAYFNRYGNEKNEKWIKDNWEYLEQEYWGQYIGVINKKVIEVADTKEDLMQSIKELDLHRVCTTIRQIGDLRPISELVKLPEGDKLERKRVFQWHANNNESKNEEYRFDVLKAIVAFLNAEGGTVLIGVEDNGNIFGIENDLSMFKEKSLDKFEQVLIQVICNRIGLSFAKSIKIRFEKINEKYVCAVDIKKSAKLAFVKYEKERQLLLSFIRVGNTSQPIDIPQIYDHL